MTQLTEHLSKKLLARYALPVPDGRVVSKEQEAVNAAEELGVPVAVKAQVPAGGRGKAGAIQRADTTNETAQKFHEVTAVSFGDLQATEVLIEPWGTSVAEYYLAIVVDTDRAAPSLLFSGSGGVEVESGAEITRLPLRPDNSVPGAELRQIAYQADVPPKVTERLLSIAQALARSFIALDAQLVEINPLVLGDDRRLMALDARIVVDDNALYRQPELRQTIEEMRPRQPEDYVRDATQLEYVRLDGWLGLISGGAGMTMAAMDLIADRGGEPACFLDCSANPTPTGYGAALDLLLEDPKVRVILISIFGGLTQMDRVARTLLKVFAERTPDKPITLRLMGTNVEAAESLIEEAGFTSHRSFEEAVEVAVSSENAIGEKTGATE